MSRTVTKAAMMIASADPSGIWAWRVKFTIRFAMSVP